MNTTVVIIMIIIFFMMLFLRKSIGNTRLYAALNALREGKYEVAEKIVTGQEAKLLLSPFSILQVLLQSAILQNKRDKVLTYLSDLSKLKMNPAQKKSVYLESFNYFVPLKDKVNAKRCLSVIDTLAENAATKNTVHLIYDVVIEGKSDKLKEILDISNSTSGEEQMAAEYLVSKIYEGKGDMQQAKEFLQRAQSHFKRQMNKRSETNK